MTEVISRAKEMALKRIAMEEECLRLAKEEERFRIEEIEKARKEFATEQRRLIEAEMAEARLRAQQAVAEAEARAIKEAEEAEISKEIARLKARTPVEVLQDELEQMRAAMTEMAVGYKALLAEKRAVLPPPVPMKVVEEGWKWVRFIILNTCGPDGYTEFARLIFDDESYIVESVKSDFPMGSPGEGPENLIGSPWVRGKKWCAHKSGGNPSVTIKFSKPLKATKYAFITSPDANGWGQRIPSNFQLEGSNDNINWDVIGNGCQCALPANTQSEWKSIKPLPFAQVLSHEHSMLEVSSLRNEVADLRIIINKLLTDGFSLQSKQLPVLQLGHMIAREGDCPGLHVNNNYNRSHYNNIWTIKL